MIKHSIEYLYNLMLCLGLANNFSNRIAVNKGNNIKNAVTIFDLKTLTAFGHAGVLPKQILPLIIRLNALLK